MRLPKLKSVVLTVAVVASLIVAGGFTTLRAQGAPGAINAIGTTLSEIMTKLDALTASVESLVPGTKTTTTLLFPFASNQAGFDTGIAVSNYGDADGACFFSYFQSGVRVEVDNPQVLIKAKGQVVRVLSNVAPDFQGFILVQCNFPTARGWGFYSDTGTRNIGAGIPVEVLP